MSTTPQLQNVIKIMYFYEFYLDNNEKIYLWDHHDISKSFRSRIPAYNWNKNGKVKF